mgnify:CR=1 FL=1
MMPRFNIPQPLLSRWAQRKVSVSWLLRVSPEEYAQALKAGGYRDHYIAKELELLARLKQQLKPQKRSKEIPASPDLEPYLTARKRVKGAKEKIAEDPLEEEMRRLLSHSGVKG